MRFSYKDIRYLKDNGYQGTTLDAVKELRKFGNGGNTEEPQTSTSTLEPYVTSDPNDPRIQAYNDSLSLYNFNLLQRELEPESKPPNAPLNLSGIKARLKDYPEPLSPERESANQNILKNTAINYVNNSPNIKYGAFNENDSTQHAKQLATDARFKEKYGMGVVDYYKSKGREMTPYKPLSERINEPIVTSVDIYSPNIKPKGKWHGAAWNEDYSNVEPQQEVIYRPQPKKLPIIKTNTAYATQQQPLKQPIPDPITIDNTKYNKMALKPGWVYNIDNLSDEDALNQVIGTYDNRDVYFNSKRTFTLKDALSFPDEIKSKYNIGYSYKNRKIK